MFSFLHHVVIFIKKMKQQKQATTNEIYVQTNTIFILQMYTKYRIPAV